MTGTIDETSKRQSKRPRTDEEPPKETAPDLMDIAPSSSNALVPAAKAAPTAVLPDDILRWPIERLATTVNPTFLDSVVYTGEGGFEAPDEQLVPTVRVYEINIVTLRTQFATLLNEVLQTRFIERGDRSLAVATALALKVSTLCADVCMSALYAKLRTLHRSISTYKGRFTTPASYSKDIELPLPFALAIESFGLFETSAMKTRYSVFPVFPEGTENEGRSQTTLNMLGYEAYLSLFAEIGLPTKSVDPRERKGTAWWTCKPTYDGSSYDLKINYPPLHFSDHSAVLATMFLSHKTNPVEASMIVTPPNGEVDYGWLMKDIHNGEQIRAFSALSQWTDVYWNDKANV